MTLVLFTLGALFLTVVVAWLAFQIGYGVGLKEQIEIQIESKIRRLDAVDMTTEEAMRTVGIAPVTTTITMPGQMFTDEEALAMAERFLHEISGGKSH